MLERLHERGFADFDAAYLNVFQYPGPQGARPSELAVRLRISKQALNHLLGQLEKLGYLERQADPDDLRSKTSRPHHPRQFGDPCDPRTRRRDRGLLGRATRHETLRPIPTTPP
jgi:MarR family